MLLGIDIGGTAIKAGALTGKGEILARRRLPFRKVMAFDELCMAILGICRELEAQVGEKAEVVGLCMPGFIDRNTGAIVDGGANVPALRTASLSERLSRMLGVPVRTENDGVAAALGELHFGAGRDFSRFVLMTIGTGIGGAVVINGSVVVGSQGEPAELGAIIVEPGGVPGSRSLEDLASASALVAAYAAHGAHPPPDVPELFRVALHDPAAGAAIGVVSRYIAQALGMLINSLNLEACLIGGGVAEAGETLLAPIRAQLADFTWPMLLDNVQVLSAARGNDAGLLGAAWLAAEPGGERSATGRPRLSATS